MLAAAGQESHRADTRIRYVLARLFGPPGPGDTHLARWRCSCLVQFGDRKRPTNWWPALAPRTGPSRALKRHFALTRSGDRAAIRCAGPRRFWSGLTSRLDRARQRWRWPAWPGRAAAGRCRPGRARSCWAAPCPPCRWHQAGAGRAGELSDSDRAARRRRDPHPRDGAPVTASPSACSGPTPRGTSVITPSSASRSLPCSPSWRGSLT